MSKHEALIRDIAEEMAKIEYGNTYKSYVKYITTHANSNVWSAGFYRQQWPILVERHVPFARIAVKYMSESFETAWTMAFDGETDQREYAIWMCELHNRKVKQGLIPDQEAGNT